MAYERVSLAIPAEQSEAFFQELERIKENIGASSTNEALIKLVFTFERREFESQLYRKFIKDARIYETVWEQKKGGMQVQLMTSFKKLDFKTAKKINNDLLNLLQALLITELESEHIKSLKENIENEIERRLQELENSLIEYDL
jgi:hypothetical protein